MATSNVDIANIALRILGEPPITSLTGTQRAQQLCSQALPQARLRVYAMHPWSSLITRRRLNELAEVENLTNFAYVYSQPSDVVRIMGIHQEANADSGVVVKTRYYDKYDFEEEWPYVIEGGNIYTDAINAYARYIRLEENPAVLPNYLSDAIGAAIAAEIAYALTQEPRIAQFATQQYFTSLQLAMQLDARSQSGTDQPPQQWDKVF